MPKQVRLCRGTTAQHATFTGADGEVTFDTTKKVLVLHDGVTPGGKPIEGFLVLDPGNPPLRAIIGSVTTSVAIIVGGIALIVLPTLIVGMSCLSSAAWRSRSADGSLRTVMGS